MIFDGNSTDSRMSRFLNRELTVVRSGPTSWPISPKRWHGLHVFSKIALPAAADVVFGGLVICWLRIASRLTGWAACEAKSPTDSIATPATATIDERLRTAHLRTRGEIVHGRAHSRTR